MESSYRIEDISSDPLIKQLMQCSAEQDAGFIRVHPQGFMYPSVMAKYIDKIKAFEVKDDDLWICSFPKTGTTLTQEMVWCLKNKMDFDTSKKIDLDERSVFFEWKAILKESAGKFYEDQIDIAAALPSPRTIKTHLPFTMLPDQILSGAKRPKMIYIVRNSRDTCVSMFHHWKLLYGFSGTFDLWSEIFYNGLSGYYSPFFKHVETYYNSNYQNILFLKYEDMKTDLKKVVLKVSSFIEKEYPEDDIDCLLDHLSFKNFLNTPALNKSKRIKVAVANNSSHPVEGVGFVRKGIVGDWVNYFTPGMSAKFLEKEEELFQSTGLRL